MYGSHHPQTITGFFGGGSSTSFPVFSMADFNQLLNLPRQDPNYSSLSLSNDLQSISNAIPSQPPSISNWEAEIAYECKRRNEENQRWKKQQEAHAAVKKTFASQLAEIHRIYAIFIALWVLQNCLMCLGISLNGQKLGILAIFFLKTLPNLWWGWCCKWQTSPEYEICS